MFGLIKSSGRTNWYVSRGTCRTWSIGLIKWKGLGSQEMGGLLSTNIARENNLVCFTWNIYDLEYGITVRKGIGLTGNERFTVN